MKGCSDPGAVRLRSPEPLSELRRDKSFAGAMALRKIWLRGLAAVIADRPVCGGRMSSEATFGRRHGGQRNRRPDYPRDVEPPIRPESRDNSRQNRPFAPSPAQVQYRNAVRQACIARETTSDSAMTAKLGMSRQTLWEWRHDSRFVAWLKEGLTAGHDIDFQLVIARHIQLAIGGSVRSAELLLRLKVIGVF